MQGLDLLHILVAVAVTGVLIWGGVSDILHRKIPNRCVLAVIGLFVVWAGLDHGAGLTSSLAAALISFVIGYGLYSVKVMGAGDVKLFSALALFAGLKLLGVFALATVISGGVVALGFMIAQPTRAAVMFTLKGKGDFGPGIPYGVAIGFGALVMIWGCLASLLPPSLLSLF